MKFSESWLREWVDPDISSETLLEQLTMAGLEVDSISPAAPPFEQVVVAEVVEVLPHPDADRLRVTQVDAGEDEPLTIVTNVADIAVGEKVAVAKVGCQLPDGTKIKKAKLRGVASFGMFCSMGTLGLVEESAQLERLADDAPVGRSIREYMALDDQIIEVDLTPNRGDCLGVAGIAREVGVINQMVVTPVAIEPVESTIDRTFPVSVEQSQPCPRYLGRVIEGVDASCPTPLWMQERLRRAGIRSLGPLVDITNYVMIELGQPMHAFDLEQLQGGVTVRHASEGERMTLLDGKELELDRETLLIADERGPLALAGIMGGEQSGIRPETRDLFLECAFFAPLAVAGKARSYGLHTDSSHRFERGVDPQLQQRAMERATRLLLDIVGGEAGPIIEVVSEKELPGNVSITLREERLSRVLGLSLDAQWVGNTLQGLGLDVVRTEDGWQAGIPSWRFDLAIEADLIEELGRIHGYDQLPLRSPQISARIDTIKEGVAPLAQLRQSLVDQGYHEVVTYSFVDPELQKIMDPDGSPLPLANPISSDLSVMRTTLWPGLLQCLEYNSKRQQSHIRLFESGLRFVQHGEKLQQQRVLSGLVFGDKSPEQWSVSSESVDFFDVKGDLEVLLEAVADVRFVAKSHPVLHPGVSAAIEIGEKILGWVGAIHPSVAAERSLPRNIYLFELDLELLEQRVVPAFSPLSKFPMIRRDLSILLKDEISSEEVLSVVRACVDPYLLREVRLFDHYQGEHLDAGQKSLAFGLMLQSDERTLTDEDVETVVSRVVQQLNDQFEAVLRD